ncbi:hypothetical protein M885DRAFT_495942 [Pelagophyceae sp. CCMP2097]|nr:hypothetical protein M885DRAFT_495942 [Pelagophyceae sp. CCMP2097]
MLPWLAEANDQRRLYGDRVFSTPSAQGQFVREWCAKNAPSGSAEFTVGWYPARYAGGIGSILGTDDITSHIPSWENDVVILEEPEHLNWYRNGPRWTTRFNHVVGVGHTNYEAYASCEPSREKSSSIDVLAERVFTETVTRAHCDVVLQLSATLRPLPHSRVCNVHGVREVFLAMGEEKAYARREFQEAKAAPCYFLGKALWAKGYDQLLLLLASADLSEIYSHVDAERLALRTAEDEAFPKMKFLESLVPALASAKEEALPAAMPVLIDCFGNGPDLCAIEAKSGELCAPLDFKGAADHALDSVFGAYDIFVNPSISEVLCTATAEALAMGKRVVISRHPSNEFFYDFERCHTFAPGDDAEFASQLLRAVRASAAERKQARAAAPPAFFKNNTLLSSIAAYSLADPKATLPGLDVAERRALSWEAATDRLVAAAALDARAAPARLALASLVMHSPESRVAS